MKQHSSPADASGLAVLIGLQNTGRHIYAGTVAPVVKQRRRTANKVARRSRRINRAAR